jgi:hypothetical protein
VQKPPPVQPIAEMKESIAKIDDIYAEIAEEAKRFIAETPQITELTPEAAAAARAAKNLQQVKSINSLDKLNIAYSLLHQSGKKDT